MRPEKTADKESQVALTRKGQRVVNLMWESTQRNVALVVVVTSLLVNGWLAIYGSTEQSSASHTFLVAAANLVIGFYFGRTNHELEGGVGMGEKGR